MVSLVLDSMLPIAVGAVTLVLAALLLAIWAIDRHDRQLEADVLAVLAYGDEYTAMVLQDVILGHFDRRYSFASLYLVLDRLERAGKVQGRWGEERPEARGGRRRRYYALIRKETGDGK